MSKPMSYEQRKNADEEYKRSIRKVKVDKKSAQKIFKIIRENSRGIMDNNLTYGLGGSRVEQLIEEIEDHVKLT